MDLIQLSLLSPLDFSTKKSDVNTTNMSPVSYSLAPTSSTTETTTVVADKPKSTVTRPFKAYPKDPLSFQTVGLYGLPLHVLPGSPESLIHQQSNHAYTEFRKQMLSQQNPAGKTRRLSQQQSPQPQVQQLPQQQQMDLSSSGGGNAFMGNGVTSSGGEDSHSNSDEGSSGGSVNNEKSPQLKATSTSGNISVKTEQQMKDEAYWEKRRKNNEAAKRSRDARRAKEDEIAIRAAFLEQENLKLRFEVCDLKSEVTKLRSMMMFKSP